MVGDSGLYGNFNQFESLIQQAQFTEQWYVDTANSQYVYYAKITVDTLTAEYAWGVDTLLNTGIHGIFAANNTLSVYPNPFNNYTQIDLSAFFNTDVTLAVTNAIGQQVYIETFRVYSNSQKAFYSIGLPKGVYNVNVYNSEKRLSGRLVKE
jgi:hypothetical protein